jgi:hypothetical protein
MGAGGIRIMNSMKNSYLYVYISVASDFLFSTCHAFLSAFLKKVVENGKELEILFSRKLVI